MPRPGKFTIKKMKPCVENIDSRYLSPSCRRIELFLLHAVWRVTADDSYRDLCKTLVNTHRNELGIIEASTAEAGVCLWIPMDG